VREVEGPNLLTRGCHFPVRLRGRSHQLGTAEVEKWSQLPQDASAKTRASCTSSCPLPRFAAITYAVPQFTRVQG
jgi:hypothetical protein